MTNKQIAKEHKKIFEVFHNSINELRDYFGWTARELNKHIDGHFKILNKEEGKNNDNNR